MFGKKNKRRKPKASEDLNLIALMDLFIGLIPFLLISASFLQLGAVDAEMPTLTTATEAAQKKEDSITVDLIFNLSSEKMNISGYTQKFSSPVAEINQDFPIADVKNLEAFMIELKKKYPQVGMGLFRVASEVPYGQSIAWLSHIKKSPELASVVLATEVQ